MFLLRWTAWVAPPAGFVCLGGRHGRELPGGMVINHELGLLPTQSLHHGNYQTCGLLPVSNQVYICTYLGHGMYIIKQPATYIHRTII